jgi:hypothetical protein
MDHLEKTYLDFINVIDHIFSEGTQ